MSNVRGDVNQGDCYSIERTFQGDFADATTGCVPQEINYVYYNGGWDAEYNYDTGYPQEVYARVKISITSSCSDPIDNPDSCEITVEGVGTCNSCTYEGGQDKVTMADCSNLAGVFPSGTTPSVLFEYDGDSNPYDLQFFPLVYDEDRCNHPALNIGAISQEPYYPSSVPSGEAPSPNPYDSSYTELPYTSYPTSIPSGEAPSPIPYDSSYTELPYKSFPTSIPSKEAPSQQPYTEVPYTSFPTSIPSGEAPSQKPYESSYTELPQTSFPTSIPSGEAPTTVPSSVETFVPTGGGTVDPFYDVEVDVQDACLEGYVMATVKDKQGNAMVGVEVGVLLAGVKSYEGGGVTDDEGQYMYTFTVDPAETNFGEDLWCSIAVDNPGLTYDQQVPCGVKVCKDYTGGSGAASSVPTIAGPSSVPSGGAPSMIPWSSYSETPSIAGPSSVPSVIGTGTTVPSSFATWGPPTTVPSGVGTGSGTVDPFYDVSVDVQDACLDGYVLATVKDSSGSAVVGVDVGFLLAGVKSYEGGGKTDEEGQYMFTFTVDPAEASSGEALWCSIAVENPAMPNGEHQQVPCSVQVCKDYTGISGVTSYAPSIAGPSSVPSGGAPSMIPWSSYSEYPLSFQTGGPTSSYTKVPPTTVPTSLGTDNPYFDVSVEAEDACLDGSLTITVKDSDGNPVMGVDVGILLSGVESYEGGGLTDEDGQFFFSFIADPIDATGDALWCSIAVENPGLPQDQQVPCAVAVCSGGYVVSQRPSSVSASALPTMAGPTGVPDTSEPTLAGPTELPYSSVPTMSQGITAPPTGGPTASDTEVPPTTVPTSAVSDTKLGGTFTVDDVVSTYTLRVGLDIYLFFFKDEGSRPDFYAVDQFATNTAEFYESVLMSDSSFSDFLLNVTLDDIKVEYSADSPDEAKVTMMANIILDPATTVTSHQAAAVMSETNLNKYIGHYVRFNPAGGKTDLNGVKRVKVVVKDFYTGSGAGAQ